MVGGAREADEENRVSRSTKAGENLADIQTTSPTETNMSDRFVVCPHCRTHVPHGATVCTGCHSRVQYGPPPIAVPAALVLSAIAGTKMGATFVPWLGWATFFLCTVALLAGAAHLFKDRIVFYLPSR